MRGENFIEICFPLNPGTNLKLMHQRHIWRNPKFAKSVVHSCQNTLNTHKAVAKLIAKKLSLHHKDMLQRCVCRGSIIRGCRRRQRERW
jgi:hypothetical protein